MIPDLTIAADSFVIFLENRSLNSYASKGTLCILKVSWDLSSVHLLSDILEPSGQVRQLLVKGPKQVKQV
jgi:hypothetical protein